MVPRLLFIEKVNMKSYKDLEVYQGSRQSAIKVHLMSLKLPKFELYEEGSQIRRSSKAVTSLIVEGYGRRRFKADFIKYLVYAHAECDETIVHLDFLFDTESLSDHNFYVELKTEYATLSRKINNFIHWVEHNLNDYPNAEATGLKE